MLVEALNFPPLPGAGIGQKPVRHAGQALGSLGENKDSPLSVCHGRSATAAAPRWSSTQPTIRRPTSSCPGNSMNKLLGSLGTGLPLKKVSGVREMVEACCCRGPLCIALSFRHYPTSVTSVRAFGTRLNIPSKLLCLLEFELDSLVSKCCCELRTSGRAMTTTEPAGEVERDVGVMQCSTVSAGWHEHARTHAHARTHTQTHTHTLTQLK